MLTSHDQVILKRKHVTRDFLINILELLLVMFFCLAITIANDDTLNYFLK